MEFNDLLRQRRSCRDFSGQPVTQEQIDQVIDAFVQAPSPLNLQPWSFVVITDAASKAQVRAVGEAARQAVVDGGGPGWAAKYPFDFIDQAPVLIAVLYDPGKGGLGGFFKQPHGALMAAAAGVQNLMMAAAELGLGTLWFTFFDPDQMRAVLGVPEGLEFAGVIPLGVPGQESKAPPRKAPKVFQERYES